MSSDSEKLMHQFAEKSMGLRADDSEAFRTVGSALRQIADAGVDSGLGFNSADFWLKIADVEYFVNVRRSNNQLALDANKA